jgi:hypothetical protein
LTKNGSFARLFLTERVPPRWCYPSKESPEKVFVANIDYLAGFFQRITQIIGAKPPNGAHRIMFTFNGIKRKSFVARQT